jgi:predicted DNA-binding protein
MAEKKQVNIGIRFPKELHERLRKVAFKERRSINKIVLELVERYCDEREGKNGRGSGRS